MTLAYFLYVSRLLTNTTTTNYYCSIMIETLYTLIEKKKFSFALIRDMQFFNVAMRMLCVLEVNF